MTDETAHEYPHTYKIQREREKGARINRERQINEGATVPPVCGFTYKKRVPRRKPEGWTGGLETCARVAGSGTTHHGFGYCDYHEVQAHNEMLSGKKGITQDVVAAKKIAYANSSFFGERQPTDPHDALMQEISRTAGIIKWIEAHMEEMRDGGMTEDAILTQFSKVNGFVPNVWMELYSRERDHLVKTCVAAIKAGVAERRIQIAEQQGQLIVAMMMAFIHDPELGLSAQQISIGPKIIRKHILDIPRENADSEAYGIIEAVGHGR